MGDYEILDPILEEKYKCPICHELFKQPTKTQCGHTFCFDCIKRTETNFDAQSWTCPLCRRTLIKNTSYSNDVKTSRSVANIRVRCRICGLNYRQCEQVIHDADVAQGAHQYARISVTALPSTSQTSLGDETSRVTANGDSIVCPYCDSNLEPNTMLSQHWAVCARTNLTRCPTCGDYVARNHLFEHVRFCEPVTLGQLYDSSRSTRQRQMQQLAKWPTYAMAGLAAVGAIALFAFLRAI